MSRDIFPLPPGARILCLASSPQRNADVAMFVALVFPKELAKCNGFILRDRDDAIGFLKLASVTVAVMATMVLSETRGL